MYGSYSSYSSISASRTTAPIDIGSARSTCAFPSWPQRSCLDDQTRFGGCGGSASSYLSDEDLFLGDDFDDASSNASSSASSRSNSNASSVSPPPHYRQLEQPFALPLAPPPTDELEQLARLEKQRAERQAYQRELVRSVLLEKELRKQAAQAARRQQRRAAAGAAAGAPSATASRKKAAKLAAIAEDN